jgi:hypothetical protein
VHGTSHQAVVVWTWTNYKGGADDATPEFRQQIPPSTPECVCGYFPAAAQSSSSGLSRGVSSAPG